MDKKATVVLIEGCYDIFHFGHLNAIRQARSFGTHLVVGINDEETSKEHKNTLLTTSEERLEIISGLKWVDTIISDAPYILDYELTKRFGINIVTHGDDLILTEDGRDIYEEARRDNSFRTFRRTLGISTTDIVGRLILRTRNFGRFSPDHEDYLKALEDEFRKPYVDNLGGRFSRIPVYSCAEAGKVDILDGIHKSRKDALCNAYKVNDDSKSASDLGYKIIAESPFICEDTKLNAVKADESNKSDTGYFSDTTKNLEDNGYRIEEIIADDGTRKNNINEQVFADSKVSSAGNPTRLRNVIEPVMFDDNRRKFEEAERFEIMSTVHDDVNPTRNYMLDNSENRDPNAPVDSKGFEFSANKKNRCFHETTDLPTLGQVNREVIYISGVFDLYHAGHAAFIRQASILGKRLIVGLYTDSKSRKINGEEPVMSTMERKLVLLGNKFIDEVIVDVPYPVTRDFLAKNRITKIVCNHKTAHLYNHLLGFVNIIEIKTKFDYLDANIIVQRILHNYEEYARKIEKLTDNKHL